MSGLVKKWPFMDKEYEKKQMTVVWETQLISKLGKVFTDFLQSGFPQNMPPDDASVFEGVFDGRGAKILVYQPAHYGSGRLYGAPVELFAEDGEDLLRELAELANRARR